MKLAILTGASKGIGRAAAALFFAEGQRVINLSRSACPVEGVESRSVDLADEAALAALLPELRAAAEEAEAVTLVHNAALMLKDRVGELPLAGLRRVLEVGLMAPSALNDALIGAMKPGSSILYVGSTLSEKAVPGTASYTISKHAMIGMMRSTCQDLAGAGIHTACICPGFTDTEMLRAHVQHDEAILAAVAKMSSFERLIHPEEIAGLLLYASRSPVLNGAVLHANLGQIER